MWNQRQQLKRQALLEKRAQAMRHQPTPSEAKLWEALRWGQRGSHRGREGVDSRRDRMLARLGYRVVRVEAETVLRNLVVGVEAVRVVLAV